jgi:hypothetical protein
MWGGKMLLTAIRDGGANALVGRVDANERNCKKNCDAVRALTAKASACETYIALLRQENTIRREKCAEHEATMRDIKREIDGIGRRQPRGDNDE